MKKIYHFSPHEHVQQDLESLISHFKLCSDCNRFQMAILNTWEIFRKNLSQRTCITVCMIGGVVKIGMFLIL